MKILADYAPSTQRKDKFGINLDLTKGQMRKKEAHPFLALFSMAYGWKVLPTFFGRLLYMNLMPELAAYKYANMTVQKRLLSKSDDRTICVANSTIEKTADGFYFYFPITTNKTPTDLLNSVFSINKADASDQLDDQGEVVLESIYSRFTKMMEERFGDRFTYTAENIMSLCEKTKEKLAASCIKTWTFQKNQRGTWDILASVFITKEEAEQLAHLPFVGVRPMDLYPLLTNWVQNYYEKGPISSLSLTRIATNMDKSSIAYAKTNEHNLLLNVNGEILYIPKVLDNTKTYEDAYIRFCTPSDPNNKRFGFMVMSAVEKQEKAIKLPVNMAILTDWTNAKFTYSNSSGNVVTLDLSQCRPITANHVYNVFRRTTIDRRDLVALYKAVSTIQQSDDIFKVNLEDGRTMDMLDFFDIYRETQLVDGQGDFHYIDIVSEPELYPLVEVFTKCAKVLEEKRDVYCNRNSVSSWISLLGMVKAVSVYGGSNWATTVQQMQKNTSAAVNQGVTPDWEPQSVPFWTNMPGVMPHQKRVLNMLKDNPNFALLPVAAGGGKTPIAILDILTQYAQGRNAPYMVMCPSKLVSQYAQEIVFFTSGKLNTIPITTSVLQREGLKRLQKIFEAAPRNTVVVVGYDALKYNSFTLAYGINAITRYPLVEFLRQFQFQYALCDESHELKNLSSSRSTAVRQLLSDVPNIRLASGTLAYNRVFDLIGQVAIMDPSVFGTEEDFRTAFGKFDDKGRYIGLRAGGEVEANALLKSNMVIAGAQRKEWAALLPEPVTEYHLVQLSVQEQEVYNNVLATTTNDIESNPILKKSMEEIERLRENPEKNAELIDELEERMSKRLTPYLQKLERLTMDPLRESGMLSLVDENYVGQKVQKIAQICRKHITDGVPGKIIIFTQNTKSTEAIYRVLSADPVLSKSGLLYQVGQKAELINKFNTDDNIKWMVGIEVSLNTGLNLQAASRIIRAEYPWQPGAIEQGDARILRPLLKSKDGRKYVYFDWICVDGTIDTLKISRLMAKSVEVGRFEHAGDSRYTTIGIQRDPVTGEDVNIVPMVSVTLKTLREKPRFGHPIPGTDDMMAGEYYSYFTSMKQLHTVTRNDYITYREKHPEELNPDGTMKSTPITVEPNPKDAKLLSVAPYVEGTNLFNQDELGLVRLDNYFNKMFEDEEDEQPDTTTEPEDNADAIKAAIETASTLTAWCEYGECAIQSISKTLRHCWVRPIGGDVAMPVATSSVFVVTKANIPAGTLKARMGKAIGIKEWSEPEYVAPAIHRTVDMPDELPKQDLDPTEEEREKAKQEADLTINLSVALVNGSVVLRFTDFKNHELGINVLQQSGFQKSPEYYRAQIRNFQVLENWFVKMTEMGLKFKGNYDYSGAWIEIKKQLKRQQSKMTEDGDVKLSMAVTTRMQSRGELQDTTRWENRVSNDVTVLRVRPMLSNGVVFAMMPSTKLYPLGAKIRRKRVPNMKWELGPEAYERYFTSKRDAVACLKELQNNGLTIANLEHVNKLLSKFRTIKFEDAKKIRQKTKKTLEKKPLTKKVLNKPVKTKKPVEKTKRLTKRQQEQQDIAEILRRLR